jgi:hypothetical protein
MDVFSHLIPLLSIASGVLISLTVSHRRSSARETLDAARLRAALQVELAMLRASYQDSLAGLGAGAEFLPSWRQMTPLYRANLTRLLLLTEPEVTALVAAYGQVEAAETYLATVCKQGGSVYRVLAGETPVDAIRQRFCMVQDCIAAALAAIAPSGRHETSAITPPLRNIAARTEAQLAEQTARA